MKLSKKERKLRCKSCGYTWPYRGISNFYTTCPRCLFKVNVKKRRVL